MKIRYIDITKYKYLLIEDVQVQSSIIPPTGIATEQFAIDMSGLITIRAGFMWDGASGGAIDTAGVLPASLLHDLGYRAIRLGLLPLEPYRKLFDQLYRDEALKDGASWWRIRYHYFLLRTHGEAAAMPQGEEDQPQEAP